MLKTIPVEGYTVTEAGPLEAARFARLAARYDTLLAEAREKGDAADDNDLDRLLALSVWPQVAACAAPTMSMDEWFQIPLETVRALREAATQLNPNWFVVATPAEVEKKTRLRHKRTMRA